MPVKKDEAISVYCLNPQCDFNDGHLYYRNEHCINCKFSEWSLDAYCFAAGLNEGHIMSECSDEDITEIFRAHGYISG